MKKVPRRGWRGYAFSRAIAGSHIPHRVQSLVLRTYAEKHKLLFLLSVFEYHHEGSYQMLESVYETLPAIEGLVFYSLNMLPERAAERRKLYDAVLGAGAGLRFALEELHIAKEADVAVVEDILAVKRLSDGVTVSLEAPPARDLASLGLRLGPKGKSPAYYFAGPEKAVTSAAIAALKAQVKDTPGGAVRICLHDGPQDPVHDMVIVIRQGPPVAPHKHVTRPESYHLIEGKLRIQFFDEKGKKTTSVLLGGPGSGLPLMYRVPKNVWHATDPETDFAVFHESRPGPFDAADTVVRSK